MHEKNDGFFQDTDLTTKTIPQHKEREREKKGPGALWDSYYRPAVFSVDIEIYEKFQITCDFVVNILWVIAFYIVVCLDRKWRKTQKILPQQMDQFPLQWKKL